MVDVEPLAVQVTNDLNSNILKENTKTSATWEHEDLAQVSPRFLPVSLIHSFSMIQ